MLVLRLYVFLFCIFSSITSQILEHIESPVGLLKGQILSYIIGAHVEKHCTFGIV